MIKQFDTQDKHDLKSFPSAEAQGRDRVRGAAVKSNKKKKSRGVFYRLFQISFVLIILLVVGMAGVFWTLSKGPVSNEQLRVEVENKLTALLGDKHKALIGDAKIAIGRGGLVAVDAHDVKILKDGTTNLGVAQQIAVKLKPVPLISGEVIAKSIELKGASIAVDRIAGIVDTQELRPIWPRSIDLEYGLRSIGDFLRQANQALQETGLENVKLSDAKLVGFDQLGLRSRTARLVDLNIQKNPSAENSLSYSGSLETQFGNWNIQGNWTEANDGSAKLRLKSDGIQLMEFLSVSEGLNGALATTNAVALSMELPFAANGDPNQAIVQIDVGDGKIALGKFHRFETASGKLNLRLLPENNQIDIERSQIRLDDAPVQFVGGLRYPKTPDDDVEQLPVFQFKIEKFDAFGLVGSGPAPVGSLTLQGVLDPLRQFVDLKSVTLGTPNGSIDGRIQLGLDAEIPAINLSLNLPEMPVEEFKQFWPGFLAHKTRKWVDENVTGGIIKNAWVKADFPSGLFGQDEKYTPDNLSAQFPITQTKVKTAGKLPPLSNANGTINLKGSRTTVQLDSATAKLASGGVKVGKSSFTLGSYTHKTIPAEMKLALSGGAGNLVRLASLDPLNFGKQLGVKGGDVSGNASAKVNAHFLIGEKTRLAKKPWSASVKVKNGASKTPIAGQKVSGADLTIKANPQSAAIEGTAKLDGQSVKLALKRSLDGKSSAGSKVTLTLDAAARKKMGLDTGDILQGTIGVSISGTKTGKQIVTADLKNATLNLPWIGWSKGKGIPATAKFEISQNSGAVRIGNLDLRGKGFRAKGALRFDKAGLKKANLKQIRLNASDDFDLDVERTKAAYNVNVNARNYDGRALIRSFLSSSNGISGKKGTNINIKGRVRKLVGFGGQALSDVRIDFRQRGTRISKAIAQAMAAGGAPTVFSLTPTDQGMQNKISTSNAGSVLRFLDLYSKIRGGTINATLVRDPAGVFSGPVVATNFTLLDEPRLSQLFQKARPSEDVANGEQVAEKLRTIDMRQAKVDRLQATVIKGPGFLTIKRGRLSGGDASAAFDGRVYDKNNRMNVKGTFLPGRGLNKFVSQIPLLGLAFGKGKVNGLLGITFKLSGRYGNPTLQVNPFSIIAPGVFRQIFKF